jgi:hypothetical protein
VFISILLESKNSRFVQAIPLFVTSLFVPLLLVTLRVIRSAGEKPVRLTTPEATKWVLSRFHHPVKSNSLPQIHLLSDVLTNNHASDWWLHDCFSVEQDSYRSLTHYSRP